MASGQLAVSRASDQQGKLFRMREGPRFRCAQDEGGRTLSAASFAFPLSSPIFLVCRFVPPSSFIITAHSSSTDPPWQGKKTRKRGEKGGRLLDVGLPPFFACVVRSATTSLAIADPKASCPAETGTDIPPSTSPPSPPCRLLDGSGSKTQRLPACLAFHRPDPYQRRTGPRARLFLQRPRR